MQNENQQFPMSMQQQQKNPLHNSEISLMVKHKMQPNQPRNYNLQFNVKLGKHKHCNINKNQQRKQLSIIIIEY